MVSLFLLLSHSFCAGQGFDLGLGWNMGNQMDAYGLDPEAYQKATYAWDYIRQRLLCPSGEWYWSIRANGEINHEDDMAGFWKCPYHNSRQCLFFEE